MRERSNRRVAYDLIPIDRLLIGPRALAHQAVDKCATSYPRVRFSVEKAKRKDCNNGLTNCGLSISIAAMSFWRWWRSSADRDWDRELLLSYRKTELERRQIDSQIELKKQEFEARKIELEMEHIEELADQRRKDRQFKIELQKFKEDNLIGARKKLAEKRAASNGQQCRACANPSEPTLTAPEIQFHNSGHGLQ